MVRLYYLAILHKTEGKNTVLWDICDLWDFGYFKRNSAKEFMRFSCQVLVGRTDPGCKVSVREQMYVCHVSVEQDHLAVAAVTDDEYPYTVAHLCLQDLLVDYMRHQNRRASTSSPSYPGPREDLLQKYREPRESDHLAAVRHRLDETRIVLHQTMEAVMRRGENLDDLVTKANDLSVQTKTFYKTAKKTNACCHAF